MNERNTNTTQEFDPSLGAYPTDIINGEVPLDENGNPIDPTGTLAARGDGAFGFHNDEMLWDQGDTRNPDEATGKVASTQNELLELEDVSVVDATTLNIGREATIGLDPNDEAARWLAANDPDHKAA